VVRLIIGAPEGVGRIGRAERTVGPRPFMSAS
jgi:hypothetical protein